MEKDVKRQLMLAEIKELNHKNNMYAKLGNTQKFFEYYVTELPKNRTNVAAFHVVNDLYFDLFGEYRYSSYDSFRRVYARYLKNEL